MSPACVHRLGHLPRRPSGLLPALTLAAAALLAACGGGGSGAPPAAAPAAVPSPSAGQVAPPAAAQQLTFYAASRLADQASFGATPALVAEIRAKGAERWIDEQFALPLQPMDVTPAWAVLPFPDLAPIPQEISMYPTIEFSRMALTAADQLRLRVTWALSQFIVAAYDGNAPQAGVAWINVLYGNSFGNYRQLLLDTSTNRLMGNYLNNDQNRPKSAECQHCAPNENFARELMQLFSIGVVKLNPDGTVQRDGRGRAQETYTQRDVEEMARVLTGWTQDPNPPDRPRRDGANWTRPMVPSTFRHERDSGAKQVLGRSFRAGQSTRKDLEDAIDLLMNHPNIAPFVATRLIQHLVKSDPTPAYVGRVAAKFINNGSGVRGDMKAVLKAVLLDTEARAADNPTSARGDEGKIREPYLHRTALWRGLGCTRFPLASWGGLLMPQAQTPLLPRSVFSFYAPTDRAPGSNILAPEQKLMINAELQERLSQQEAGRKWIASSGTHDYSEYRSAGCKLDELATLFSRGPAPFIDALSERHFRGAMPPTLRSNLEQLMRLQNPPWNRNDPLEGTLRLLGFALSTPYYGAKR